MSFPYSPTLQFSDPWGTLYPTPSYQNPPYLDPMFGNDGTLPQQTTVETYIAGSSTLYQYSSSNDDTSGDGSAFPSNISLNGITSSSSSSGSSGSGSSSGGDGDSSINTSIVAPSTMVSAADFSDPTSALSTTPTPSDASASFVPVLVAAIITTLVATLVVGFLLYHRRRRQSTGSLLDVEVPELMVTSPTLPCAVWKRTPTTISSIRDMSLRGEITGKGGLAGNEGGEPRPEPMTEAKTWGTFNNGAWETNSMARMGGYGGDSVFDAEKDSDFDVEEFSMDDSSEEDVEAMRMHRQVTQQGLLEDYDEEVEEEEEEVEFAVTEYSGEFDLQEEEEEMLLQAASDSNVETTLKATP